MAAAFGFVLRFPAPRGLVAGLVLLLTAFSQTVTTQADDWPQWMGPERDGVWRETGIVRQFPADGPRVVWKQPVGLGYSGPAVVGDRVFVPDYQRTTGDLNASPQQRNTLAGEERVVCLNVATGEPLWVYAYDCPYFISYPAGPRCTPTVDQDQLFFLGAEGHLACLRVDTGEKVWSRELKQDYAVTSPIWGFSAHPLVEGDHVITMVGGPGSAVVAFDRHSGKEAWKALTAGEPGYCPPQIITAAGVRQLIVWDADNLSSLNPETGAVYWTTALKPNYGMAIMAPRRHGDLLFASAIGEVAAAFRLATDKPGVTRVWTGDRSSAVYCANSTPLIDDTGTLFGCDCRTGGLRGVELATGKLLWESFAATTGERRAPHGTAFIVRNEDRYFLMSETGELILAELSAKAYKELGRAKLVEPLGAAFGRPVVWSHPAFAQGKCFARNDGEIVCVDLIDAEPAAAK